MIGPTRKSNVHVRFEAPAEPGIYPYVCTFPGHWVMMKGDLVVANSTSEAEAMLAARQPTVVKKWTMTDFADFAPAKLGRDDKTMMRGMQAFMKARCNQCHVVAGHGIPLGPELTKVSERYRGEKLLRQLVEPSSEINKKFQTYRFLLDNGSSVTGVVVKEEPTSYQVVPNLLIPHEIKRVAKDDIARMQASKVSSMPVGLVDVLQKQEIYDVVAFLQAGGMKHE